MLFNRIKSSVFKVSVPTGDFSFIYLLLYSIRIPGKWFPSPPGTFLLSMMWVSSYNTCFFTFPSPPGTFLLSISCGNRCYHCKKRFRPHRGLFFYLLEERHLALECMRLFPSPPGTFLLSIGGLRMYKLRIYSFRPHRGLFFYLSVQLW